MSFFLNNYLDHSQGCIYILVLMFCYRSMTLPLFSLRIELLDKLCRDLKILYLQSNLIPKIGKLCWEKSIHQEEWRFYQELKEKQPLGVFFFQEFVFKDIFLPIAFLFSEVGGWEMKHILGVACGQRVDSMLGIFPWSITWKV